VNRQVGDHEARSLPAQQINDESDQNTSHHSGPKKVDFNKVRIEDGAYESTRQGGPDSHPQTTQKLTLPVGDSKDGGIPEGTLGPNSRHANERGKRVVPGGK
jgi:hypothetical protein